MFPFDLHVLGTPPAFILSQDQTLIKSFFLASPNWLVSILYFRFVTQKTLVRFFKLSSFPSFNL